MSTHNQALSALLFLYREVLGIDLPWLADIQRPTRPRRIPSVPTVDEVRTLLAAMDGEVSLLARLLYGTWLRLSEGLGLRVKDLDFDRGVIIVRQGKGGKDRVVMLPDSLKDSLRLQVRAARALWERDRAGAFPGVAVPDALASKYSHRAGTTRPLRRQNDDDLHTHDQGVGRGDPQPAGPAGRLTKTAPRRMEAADLRCSSRP